ncbi:hypothetical protein L226DRAFT_228900 [Lentinus tigrinus ALCF2SS1-7]|uniref:Uncharacterized protein n=1 Tax=Lentinus tigrinus ALCF2SS1-6 TaxID=1328759 RepID=A0A5C2S326_9APHY|nr:hypothetical protein L227DRAFT_202872 [Lentinus tigrinus ALCF2SS1-6]RPD70464.1 hypothetical protein L226DRAFT_228900 [Lentinus tigrinus ALCF2SS1-7]
MTSRSPPSPPTSESSGTSSPLSCSHLPLASLISHISHIYRPAYILYVSVFVLLCHGVCLLSVMFCVVVQVCCISCSCAAAAVFCWNLAGVGSVAAGALEPDRTVLCCAVLVCLVHPSGPSGMVRFAVRTFEWP